MKCTHENIETGYGFLPKFKGLGVYSFCIDCGKIITWIDDKSSNFAEEVEYNKKICKEKDIKYEWFDQI